MPVAVLIRLALSLLAPAQDGRRIAAAAGRAAIAGVFLVLASLALLAAIGLAAAALWASVAPSFGPAQASLVVAGAFVLLSLLLLLGAWLAMKAKRQPAPAPASAGAAPTVAAPTGLPAADALLATLWSLFAKNKGTALLAALIAGVVAENMRKRD